MAVAELGLLLWQRLDNDLMPSDVGIALTSRLKGTFAMFASTSGEIMARPPFSDDYCK